VKKYNLTMHFQNSVLVFNDKDCKKVCEMSSIDLWEKYQNVDINDILVDLYEKTIGRESDPCMGPKELLLSISSFYQKLLGNMPGSVYLIDKQDRYISCNNNLVNMLGFKSRQEVIGKTSEDMGKIFNWPQEQTQEIYQNNQSVFRTGMPVYSRREIPFTDLQGKKWVQLTNKEPIRNKVGEIEYILGISLDISELVEAQEHLEDALDDAKAAAKTKIAVVHNMRHDWITPFTGIYSINEMLAKEEEAPEKKELLLMATESAELLMEHTNSILDMIEAGDGLQVVTEQLMDPWLILENVYKIFKPLVLSETLDLKFDTILEDKVEVLGDPNRLERVLMSLVSNAIKFSKKNGCICLKLRVENMNNKEITLNFVIKDAGIGMTTEQLSRIYEPLYRCYPAYEAQYKGAGTGLTIVKKYISDMGGQVTCKSALDHGTTFILTIPFKRTAISSARVNELDKF